jgi:pyruvate,water dikinase
VRRPSFGRSRFFSAAQFALKTRQHNVPEPGIDRSAPFVVAMDAADDPQVVGGKAAALARLLRSGLPIPPWIVVVPDAFQQSLDPITRQELMGDASAAAIAGAISGVFPSPEVCREVSEALRSIAAPDAVVAVRSSAVDEDGATRSFAGQLESFLFVRHADVADRIARVWQSGFHERVVAYRREHGLPGAAQPPSVIVQQMIRADVSGVAFGADPVSGRRDVVVVSAVPGLGTSLVSGECDADCWHVDADNRILDRVIARKALAHRAAVGTVEGIAREPLTADESDRPALDDKQIHAVADLARR